MPHATEPSPVVVDIHQHTTYRERTDDQLFAHQTAMGITKTVLLPAGSPVSRPSTHDGASNGLDGGISGNESCLRIVESDSDHYAFFANEVPDLPSAQVEIETYLNKGAIGIGEQKFSVDCDSTHIELIASIAREFDVPVLMHFEHDRYNLGIERFYTILEKFPTVNFIGHAQTWWGNIDARHDQTVMYPEGEVTPGGISDRYLSDYPNMFGDLSANSGRNSLMRDEDQARDFLIRHQDKLMFGSDCDDTIGEGGQCIGARTLSVLHRVAQEEAALNKILSGNAHGIMRL
jgi:predicted TIM-barrel fold metal-dependent hydrolase